MKPGKAPLPRSAAGTTKAEGLRPATLALDGGLRIDAETGAIAPGISMSVNNAFVPGHSAFSAEGAGDLADLPFLYARWTNPTVRDLERRLAALEGADAALATATGVAAIAATFLSLLKSGDHLVISDVAYAGAYELATRILPGFGIEVTPVNLSRPEDLRAAMRPNTRLVHAETPCNPILRLTDLRVVAAVAHAGGALLSVDSTLATPVITRPLEHGADLVIHSLTKFMNGHGDALGGAVIGARELIARIRSTAGVYLGAALSAQNAWLILRGIDTLFPRLRLASDNALALARHLQAHPGVAGVVYPGLPDHPQHALAAAQMALPGGIVSFRVRGDGEAVARRMAERFRVIHYAFSLGHQRSLCVWLSTEEMQATYRMTGANLADYRDWAGEGVFRLSVGLEDPADLIADLDRALAG
jgi:cystathionine gamma-synthase